MKICPAETCVASEKDHYCVIWEENSKVVSKCYPIKEHSIYENKYWLKIATLKDEYDLKLLVPRERVHSVAFVERKA